MATGYTSQLEEINYDTRRWLKERLVRAMGICIHLRDDGKMTEKEIKKELAKRTGVTADTYEESRLKSVTKTLKEREGWTDDQWRKTYDKQRKSEEANYIKSLKEYDEKKAAHQKSLDEVAALYKTAVDTKESEVVLGTLKFALSQLQDTMDFDYRSGPYRAGILDLTFSQWKKDMMASYRRDVKYYTDEIAEKKKKQTQFNPVKEYERFVNFIDSQKEVAHGK